MPIKENALGVRRLLAKAHAKRSPLTLRPQNLFSEEICSESRLLICQEGYKVIDSIDHNEIPSFVDKLDYSKPTENGFHGALSLGAQGVCRFLEVFGLYEGKGLNVAVEMTGVAPLSNERFTIDNTLESTPNYYPDLVISSKGHSKCFVEVKYAVRTYSDFEMNDLPEDKVLYSLNKSDLNGYVYAGQNQSLPVYLAIVMNRTGSKEDSTIGALCLEEKVEADYEPFKIRKKDLKSPKDFLRELYELLI